MPTRFFFHLGSKTVVFACVLPKRREPKGDRYLGKSCASFAFFFSATIFVFSIPGRRKFCILFYTWFFFTSNLQSSHDIQHTPTQLVSCHSLNVCISAYRTCIPSNSFYRHKGGHILIGFSIGQCTQFSFFFHKKETGHLYV